MIRCSLCVVLLPDTPSSSSNTGSPLIEYFRTIVHNGCDNKGAQIYLQVQVKNSLMMRLRDAAAQYTLLESI